MKLITLKEAAEILENCSAVVTEDHSVMYPDTADLTGEDDNEWLYLSWTDSDFNEFNVRFVEKNNREVAVVGGSMFLQDSEGEQVHLTILVPAKPD